MKTRFLKKKEISKFLKIVKLNYKKNHVLGRSKKIISFYYNFRNKKKLSLIGQFENKNLLSVLGVIPYKNWDDSLDKDYFIAFWVKQKGGVVNSLPLINFIFNKIKPNFLASTGINLQTSGKVFKKFNDIHIFENYFIKNEIFKEKISKNLKNKIDNKNKKQLDLIVSNKLIKSFNIMSNDRPRKSMKYFDNKYLKNPFYKYLVFNFFEKKNLKFFFICREIKLEKFNTKIIRIVDFFGNFKKNYSVYKAIKNYLKKGKYEYIDFLSTGIGDKLKNIGFTKKNKNHFIPDLFEPYLSKQIENNYCILKSNYKKNILVKGDGDLDRPNLV
jgi:hypothetical protein